MVLVTFQVPEDIYGGFEKNCWVAPHIDTYRMGEATNRFDSWENNRGLIVLFGLTRSLLRK